MLAALSYVSRSLIGPHSPEMLAIARSALRRNEELNVTGALFYDASTFYQVLEGDPAVIDALFNRIAADHRHMDVVRLDRHEVAARLFGAWSMKFVEVARAEHLKRALDFEKLRASGPAERLMLAEALREA